MSSQSASFLSSLRSVRAGMACGVLVLVSGLVAAHAARAADMRLQGVWKLASPPAVLRPPDGAALPFTALGKMKYERNRAAAAKGDYSFDMTEMRCSSPGLPRIMLTAEPLKIYVRPRIVTMLFQWNRLFRQIDMVAGPHTKPEVGTMMGVSWGHWDGKTLVVESTGFATRRLLDDLVPNSASLSLTEHLRLRNANTLVDRITVDDPKIFTRPWTGVEVYKRQPVHVFPFPEDVCLDRKAAGQLPLAR
jgi:hypothetical protein